MHRTAAMQEVTLQHTGNGRYEGSLAAESEWHP